MSECVKMISLTYLIQKGDKMEDVFNIADYMVWIWLAATVIFLIVEALTLGLTTIWLACGAFVALGLAVIGVGVWTQIIAFLIISLLLIGTTRKVFVNKLRTGSEKTNTDAIIGREGRVIEKIEPYVPGRVKVDGQNWSAIATDDTQTLDAGETVVVSNISGVKLLVKKKEEN